MNKVLIVEDEDFKLGDIVEFFEGWKLDIVRSVRDGVFHTRKNSYDLIILDMSLHTYQKTKTTSGGSPQSHGGLEIIRELNSTKNLTPVILLSQYPDMEIDDVEVPLLDAPTILNSKYSVNIISGVLHDTEELEWRDKFIEAIGSL